LTVFIPNNAAFQAIGFVPANLSAILSYHIVPDVVDYSTDLVNGTTLLTSFDESLTIRIYDKDIFINNAKIIVPNILIKEGVAHIINK
jgi:uncharacterized surface protein with fasciclin (FAS1) repeats